MLVGRRQAHIAPKLFRAAQQSASMSGHLTNPVISKNLALARIKNSFVLVIQSDYIHLATDHHEMAAWVHSKFKMA